MAAFNKLKEAMTSLPLLQLPNFYHTFVVDWDASRTGVGAVFQQNGQTITYFSSKRLSPSNHHKSVYNKELLTLVMALQKWHYLLGRKFVVHTDHSSLKFLLEHVTTPEQ